MQTDRYSGPHHFHQSHTGSDAALQQITAQLNPLRCALQADRPEDVAAEIRKALKYIPAEKLIISNDCGFGRQGCNREIAFYKASALAQGCNIVRRELGFPTTYIPAADPKLQIDVVPGR